MNAIESAMIEIRKEIKRKRRLVMDYIAKGQFAQSQRVDDEVGGLECAFDILITTEKKGTK